MTAARAARRTHPVCASGSYRSGESPGSGPACAARASKAERGADAGPAAPQAPPRMGHDSERAALIYRHEARGADKAITNAIDTHVQAEKVKRGDNEDGSADVLVPAG